MSDRRVFGNAMSDSAAVAVRVRPMHAVRSCRATAVGRRMQSRASRHRGVHIDQLAMAAIQSVV